VDNIIGARQDLFCIYRLKQQQQGLQLAFEQQGLHLAFEQQGLQLTFEQQVLQLAVAHSWFNFHQISLQCPKLVSFFYKLNNKPNL
jgi:hypothetical protein